LGFIKLDYRREKAKGVPKNYKKDQWGGELIGESKEQTKYA
jgi:hypothetical protein